MAQGKYGDYYWSTKKLPNEKYIWKVKAIYGGVVLESSLDNEDDDDKYLDTETAARTDAIHAIQCHYN